MNRREYRIGLAVGLIVGLTAFTVGAYLAFRLREMPLAWLTAYALGMGVTVALWQSTGLLAKGLERWTV